MIAHGRLVTPLPNLVVQPLEPGILKSIEVRIGQVVRKGEVLATLDPTFATRRHQPVRPRARDTLALQIDRLEAELDGSRLPGAGATGDSPQRNSRSDCWPSAGPPMPRACVSSTRPSQACAPPWRPTGATSRPWPARSSRWRTWRPCTWPWRPSRWAPRPTCWQVQAQRLEVERDHTLAVNRQRRRSSARSPPPRPSVRPSSSPGARRPWRSSPTALQQRDEVNEQLAKAQRRSELVTLSAPADAIVLEIGKKSVGSVVQDAETLFVLVPLDAPLEAEVEVSPADVGEIRVGDTARIKIDAYPFQKHGTITGKVINVSADTFSRQNRHGRSRPTTT